MKILKQVKKELGIGEILKLIRIYASENAYDMAKKLDMSTSYLSSIENNKRTVPSNLLQKIKKHYDISEELEAKYIKAAEDSQRKVIINLQKLSKEQREVSLMCARKISTLSSLELKSIKEILLKEGVDTNEY